MSDKDKETGSEKNEEKKPMSARSISRKRKVGDQAFTALQFAKLIPVNKRTEFWLSKKFDSKARKTGFDWADEFIAAGILSETPEFLNNASSKSE